MTSVAILLAAYGGSEFIVSQLESVLSQTGVSVDIYIRDDASNNATLKALEKFLGDPRVHYLQEGDATGSPAGNFFRILSKINLDRYSHIAFCDQDDIWFPEKLISALSSISENCADAYSSNLIAFDNTKSKAWFLNKCIRQKKYDYLFQGASAGCTYVLKTAAAALVLNSLGGLASNFPMGHSHDWLIYAICRSHGLKWVHDQRAFIAYRQHSVNAFGALPGLGGLLQRLRLSKNGWYREQILWQRQFLSGIPEEIRILDAIERLSILDRCYLASIGWSLRRSKRDCALLSFVIIVGLI